MFTIATVDRVMQAIGNDDIAVPTNTRSADVESDVECLIRAVSAGNITALSQLYELTVRQVFAVAWLILQSKEDAEEIVGDVYVQVWQHPGTYDSSRGNGRAWLSVMTRNRAIDRLRRRKTGLSLDDPQHEALAVSLAGTVVGPDQTLALFQSNSAVHHALQSLSEERRMLVRMAFFDGRTHEEIAAAVGMPLGTVKSHVRRALCMLQQRLEPMREITGMKPRARHSKSKASSVTDNI